MIGVRLPDVACVGTTANGRITKRAGGFDSASHEGFVNLHSQDAINSTRVLAGNHLAMSCAIMMGMYSIFDLCGHLCYLYTDNEWIVRDRDLRRRWDVLFWFPC